MRSPQVKSPSSQSASPRQAASWPRRLRTRSSTSGIRCYPAFLGGSADGASARTGMRELVARAHWYRGRLGEPGAAEGSSRLATEIGNPVLDTILT